MQPAGWEPFSLEWHLVGGTTPTMNRIAYPSRMQPAGWEPFSVDAQAGGTITEDVFPCQGTFVTLGKRCPDWIGPGHIRHHLQLGGRGQCWGTAVEAPTNNEKQHICQVRLTSYQQTHKCKYIDILGEQAMHAMTSRFYPGFIQTRRAINAYDDV
jgi:hypothetical protein